MTRREAFVLIMRKIRRLSPTPYRTALLLAASDMVALSGGVFPDERLRLTEPKWCRRLDLYLSKEE